MSAAAPGAPVHPHAPARAAHAYYDALEVRDEQAREEALFAALPAQLDRAKAQAAAVGRALADVDAAEVTNREALARLPVTRKSALLAAQLAAREAGAGAAGHDPFGGHAAIGWRGLAQPRGARRAFQSPGPLYEPEGEAHDYWRTARALFAAGFRAGDLLHNSFSYHLTPAGAIMESGAHALGCAVFPGGVGNTELQLQAMQDLRPHGYVGTPSFLRILMERAGEMRLSLSKALVSGEACPPALRDWLGERDVQTTQCYATADLGLIAYETEAREGLVLDEGVIVEIVRPGTGDPVPEGEVGEVVVTTLNADYPLIRFGTGDLSAVLPGRCPTGRTNTRIRGWLGRADQTTKVRGMFVHPDQVAAVVRRHPAVHRARLVVDGALANDTMTLHAEVDGLPDGLADALADSVREVTKLRADVVLCASGSLPNDGKVIEDRRRYD